MVHHSWTCKKTIKNPGLTRQHRKKAERTWQMVNKCKEMEQEYTRNNFTSNLNPTFFLSKLDELNILPGSMEKRLGLRFTTLLINFNHHQNGFDEVCKSTVNLAFFRLQTKITRIQKIQQGTKNESKWK